MNSLRSSWARFASDLAILFSKPVNNALHLRCNYPCASGSEPVPGTARCSQELQLAHKCCAPPKEIQCNYTDAFSYCDKVKPSIALAVFPFPAQMGCVKATSAAQASPVRSWDSAFGSVAGCHDQISSTQELEVIFRGRKNLIDAFVIYWARILED